MKTVKVKRFDLLVKVQENLEKHTEGHEKDYNQMINMLQMSVDEELELDSEDFAKFVMDDWSEYIG